MPVSIWQTSFKEDVKMALDIYSNYELFVAIQQASRVSSWLRDRYFPTTPRDIFSTKDVLVDIKEGSKQVAPLVIPRHNGILLERESFRTDRLAPPFIAPMRTLTIDDLESRGFGEQLFGANSIEEREAQVLMQDAKDLDQAITNREVKIAAQLLTDSSADLNSYADKVDDNFAEPYQLKYWNNEAANPNKYTPAAPWTAANANIFGDLEAIVRQAVDNNTPVTEIAAHYSVIDLIRRDEEILKLLDNRNVIIGEIAPKELPDEVSYFGKLILAGRSIDIYSYDYSLPDDTTGADEPLLAAGTLVAIAPKAGRTLYGAIKQIDPEDKKFHSYAGVRVPRLLTDVDSSVRTLRIAAAPLLMPNTIHPWVSAQVL
jgi:hypothetical protein